MTIAAISAAREVSCSTSLNRGEQYDSDLGLYYLRARYYNPSTGRFMSRDPNDGHTWDSENLHKYLYAGGDPVNRIDSTGRDYMEYVVKLYHSSAEAFAFGLEMKSCISGSFMSEAMVFIAAAEGNDVQSSGLQIVSEFEKCAGDAIHDLAYGLVVSHLFRWTGIAI
jgi:RHS repeat-associated protein